MAAFQGDGSSAATCVCGGEGGAGARKHKLPLLARPGVRVLATSCPSIRCAVNTVAVEPAWRQVNGHAPSGGRAHFPCWHSNSIHTQCFPGGPGGGPGRGLGGWAPAHSPPRVRRSGDGPRQADVEMRGWPFPGNTGVRALPRPLGQLPGACAPGPSGRPDRSPMVAALAEEHHGRSI